jgi:hypothetical protein
MRTKFGFQVKPASSGITIKKATNKASHPEREAQNRAVNRKADSIPPPIKPVFQIVMPNV